MSQLYIIPDRTNLEADLQLAKEYSLGFEYNDFFNPNVLDKESERKGIVDFYNKNTKPAVATLHGAFYDVIPSSVDKKIREVARLRIEQSIQSAREVGANAVIFHTNYNPFLNSDAYINDFVDENVDVWEAILKRHPDMCIYLENMFDRTPDIMERISERLSRYGNYGVCLDYAHAALSDYAPWMWAKRLSPYIKHVHLNDNDCKSDLHLAWGDGLIGRDKFYEYYYIYMRNAGVLIETASLENKKKSLDVLAREGFLK